MQTQMMSRQAGRIKILAVVLSISLFTSTAFAGGGNVLPSSATPKGYSLSDMAKATAFFNTGDHSAATYPETPFQILYYRENPPGTPDLTFNVRPGTTLYVPIFLADDSPPILGNFPTNVNNRNDVLTYFYSLQQLGNIYTRIVVDGTTNSLGSDYVVGVGLVKLADGPGGTQHPRIGSYIVSAAFLTPLKKGRHTVEIRVYFHGAALMPFFPPDGVLQSSSTYTVIVRDASEED
jgi:hypothetical protein